MSKHSVAPGSPGESLPHGSHAGGCRPSCSVPAWPSVTGVCVDNSSVCLRASDPVTSVFADAGSRWRKQHRFNSSEESPIISPQGEEECEQPGPRGREGCRPVSQCDPRVRGPQHGWRDRGRRGGPGLQ